MALASGGRSRGELTTQRRRSIAIALALGALVVIFFAATMVRLKGNVAKRMQLEGEPARTIILPQEQETTGGQ